MSKRLFNPLWLHFSESTPGKAKCLHCEQIVSRGGSEGKNQNTTNIWRHLEKHHNELYRETKRKKREMEGLPYDEGVPAPLPPHKQKPTQPSNKWKETDAKSKRLDKLIMEMCSTDELPFSLVSGRGFQRLLGELEPKYHVRSERFYRSDQFEVLYKTVQTSVRMLIAAKRQQPSLSFTADCSPGAAESLMSLTAHFIDERWQRRRVMLHVKAVTEVSTVDYIHQFFLPVLKYWSISQRRVFLVLRDEGADMSEDQRLNEVPGLRCSAHLLQSAVEEGLCAQSDATDAIAKVRTCAGHFRDSILAKQRLRAVQHELNVPQNDLEPDEAARWISTLAMLRRAHEQKRALNCYAQKYGSFTAPTGDEWDLIRAVTETLSPVEEVAREMSDTGSSISCVIPSVSVLKMFLRAESAATRGTAALRRALLRGLEQSYAKLEETKVMVLATLLDPRYKCNVLSPQALSVAPKWLSQEYAAWAALQEEEGEDEEREEAKPGLVNAAVEDEKPAGTDLVEQIFASILGSPQPPLVEHRSPELSGQLEQYLNEPLIDRKLGDPLGWWRSNVSRFDLLAPLARKLLSAPPASVPSERLFSESAGRGGGATEENAEKLYFLKHNLPLIKYEY